MIKKIEVPIYNRIVYICSTKEEAEATAIENNCEASDTSLVNTAGICYENDIGTCVVGVFDGEACTLVHELAHVTFIILQHCGVPIYEDDANEAFCFLIDYLFKEAFYMEPEEVPIVQ